MSGSLRGETVSIHGVELIPDHIQAAMKLGQYKSEGIVFWHSKQTGIVQVDASAYEQGSLFLATTNGRILELTPLN